MTRLVLASASPRRLSLLADAGHAPDEVRPQDVDETPFVDEQPAVLARRLARTKRDAATAAAGSVVLAADTVVAVDGSLLGKPVGDEDTAAMLRRLSGRVVTVLSGLAVRGPDGARPPESVVVATLLRFHELGGATIDAYIATGEPRGVAGGFRLQGAGAALVADRHGCWSNVVGLPLCAATTMLRPHGVELSGDGCRPGVTPPRLRTHLAELRARSWDDAEGQTPAAS